MDEVGTVADDASALGFEESGLPEPDLTVRADRPFPCLIRHQPTGVLGSSAGSWFPPPDRTHEARTTVLLGYDCRVWEERSQVGG